MKVTPLSPSMGAAIEGIDLSGGISAEQASELRAIWLENQVIVIRGQTLTPAIQIEIARAFGEPDHYPFLKGLEGYPEITPVLKREDEARNFGGIWHTDTIYQSTPPMATMLYALELPPVGGDTLFANQYLAYEQLSDGLKQTLKSLKLVSRSDNKDAAETRAARIKESGVKLNSDSLSGCHPVIRTHPETGRKSLYVSPGHSGYFDGWSEAESANLLSYLHNHQIAEEFRCRHVWQVGDLALWDNRCVLHYPVNDYHGHRRLLHRITLKGDIPA
jgi:taurine dioxygenase